MVSPDKNLYLSGNLPYRVFYIKMPQPKGAEAFLALKNGSAYRK
jgi:hypothetical protein